jgi:lipid-A-disaccharide synthase
MKYYIIAGEASGDLHGSNLIIELKKLDANAEIRCWGGDKMQATGATLIKHYKDLAFMGFSEVLKNLPVILRNLSFCKKDISQYNPDVIILIDYPGFNLRMAKWAKTNHFKVIFYISPQVWAWKESRVNLIKKHVDKMLVILPFEKAFYNKWNYEVEYAGHPLVEVIESFKKQAGNLQLITDGQKSKAKSQQLKDTSQQSYNNDKRLTINDQPSTINDQPSTINHQPSTINDQPSTINDQQPTNLVALLPGSRKQELKIKLPIMLQVAEHFPDHLFVVAKAPGIENDFYNSFLADHTNVDTVSNQTYLLLMNAKAALVTSGTATLETALFDVPEIVCYKGNAFSYQIAKRLIKIKYISLVNLIMDKEVITELIQDELTVENLKTELSSILNDTIKIEKIKSDYAELRKILQLGGNASFNAAASVYRFLKS